MTTNQSPGGARTGGYAQNEGAQSLGKGTGREGDVREDTGNITSTPTLAVTQPRQRAGGRR